MLSYRFILRKFGDFLGPFIEIMDPKISINMTRYSFKRVSIIGAVNKPGSYAWTENYILSDYIGLAGGPNINANISRVSISRKSKDNTIMIKVNLKDILYHGDKTQDVPLEPGDLVTIHQKFNWKEYRFTIAAIAGTLSLILFGYKLWK